MKDPVFILGGPMMGRLVDSLEKLAAEVVTKTSGGLIVLPRGHYLHRNATLPVEHMRRRAAAACIQCRSCSDLCPRHLLGHPFETHRVMRAFGAGMETESENGKLALLCCDCGVCEHVACPMGLSPRRINQAVKAELRAASVSYDGSREVNEDYTRWRESRRVAVPRLVARIGVARYMDLPMNDLGEIDPAEVRIPCASTSARRPRLWSRRAIAPPLATSSGKFRIRRWERASMPASPEACAAWATR